MRKPTWIDWDDLCRGVTQRGGDVIALAEENLTGEMLVIELVASGREPFWKAIQLLDGENRQIGFVECTRALAPCRFTAVNRIDERAQLIFWKCGADAIRMPIYKLVDVDRRIGRMLSFTWTTPGSSS